MAKSRFNHSRSIKNRQPAKMNFIYPGTIIEFTYTAPNVFDKKPLVLVLWNQYSENKIHGINFNYLTNTLIKEIMFALLEKHDLSVLDGEDEYDDTLPYRNLIKDPYTRIMLPTYKHSSGGDKHLSYSEAKTMMERLYNQKLRRFVNKRDIYRTYKTEKMSAPSAILFDFKNLR